MSNKTRITLNNEANHLRSPANINKSKHLNGINTEISWGAKRSIIKSVALLRLTESDIFVQIYGGSTSAMKKWVMSGRMRLLLSSHPPPMVTIVLSADMNSSLARSLFLPPASSASSSSLWSLFTHSYLVSIELFENLNRNVSPVPKYLCRMPKYDNFYLYWLLKYV